MKSLSFYLIFARFYLISRAYIYSAYIYDIHLIFDIVWYEFYHFTGCILCVCILCVCLCFLTSIVQKCKHFICMIFNFIWRFVCIIIISVEGRQFFSNILYVKVTVIASMYFIIIFRNLVLFLKAWQIPRDKCHSNKSSDDKNPGPQKPQTTKAPGNKSHRRQNLQVISPLHSYFSFNTLFFQTLLLFTALFFAVIQ